jgi:nucleoside 2-deoxyribosyltransferase
MKIYIAGPMTGLPEHNYPAFNREAEFLRRQGWEVVNPAELWPNFEGAVRDLTEVVKLDLAMLCECDTIYMLRGWERSAGARTEHAVAVWLNLEILYANA